MAAPPTTPSPAEQLSQLLATATQQYALKHYEPAAVSFSEAAELQDTINGEMNPDNADLLYQYGRCLYHVAVSNSDVLGGKVASASNEEPKRKKRKVAKTEEGDGSNSIISKALAVDEATSGPAVDNATTAPPADAAPATSTSNPFFQITGDENWTDSEDSADEDVDPDTAAADNEAAGEEEEDDFATAYEVLDMARVLLARKITFASDSPAELRQLKERLADTHDLQAEISLENERFVDAITDVRDSLAMKVELYPQESELVAEAHFKLSLALEFASNTAPAMEGADAKPVVDEAMRTEAAQEMEKALASCRARITKEETSLPLLSTTPEDTKKAEETKKSIKEVREIVADMQQRLTDLRNPPVSIKEEENPFAGVLAGLLGKDQEKKVQEVTAGANDLSGLVKRKGKRPEVAAAAGVEVNANGKGKRKAEEEQDGATGKKAKVEDEEN